MLPRYKVLDVVTFNTPAAMRSGEKFSIVFRNQKIAEFSLQQTTRTSTMHIVTLDFGAYGIAYAVVDTHMLRVIQKFQR